MHSSYFYIYYQGTQAYVHWFDILELYSTYHKEYIMKVVAITGSGISAASGIPYYRSAGSGWDKYAKGIAHARSYGNHLPELWRHWTAVGRAIEAADPNPAHKALADANAFVITQNVDGLHQKAGSENVVELHGDMRSMRCLRCKKSSALDLSTESPVCKNCGSARVRTNAVLFGENVLKRHFVAAETAVKNADLVVIAGTSGIVYPTRQLIDQSLESDTRTVLFDIEAWVDSAGFSDVVVGPVEQTLPTFLRSTLGMGTTKAQ